MEAMNETMRATSSDEEAKRGPVDSNSAGPTSALSLRATLTHESLSSVHPRQKTVYVSARQHLFFTLTFSDCCLRSFCIAMCGE